MKALKDQRDGESSEILLSPCSQAEHTNGIVHTT